MRKIVVIRLIAIIVIKTILNHAIVLHRLQLQMLDVAYVAEIVVPFHAEKNLSNKVVITRLSVGTMADYRTSWRFSQHWSNAWRT